MPDMFCACQAVQPWINLRMHLFGQYEMTYMFGSRPPDSRPNQFRGFSCGDMTVTLSFLRRSFGERPNEVELHVNLTVVRLGLVILCSALCFCSVPNHFVTCYVLRTRHA